MPRMLAPGRQLDLPLTPLDALARWPVDRGVLLLHSGRHDPRWARYSILTEAAGWYRFDADTGADSGGAAKPGDQVDRVDRGVGRWCGDPAACPVDLKAQPLTDKPFRDLRTLTQAAGEGLWIGNLSYDLGRWVEKLPALARVDRDWPIVELGWCPGYLRYDTGTRQWSACGSWRNALPAEVMAALAKVPGSDAAFRAGEPVSLVTQAAHEAAVARAKEYIAAGDIFQVNLAQRFSASFEGAFPSAPRALFRRLASVSPAWYGGYLEMGDGAWGAKPRAARAIASTSPELFLEVERDGTVVTRPIKGTLPASSPAAELEHSEKDTAELNMIVDLLRNDLGRVCSYGSVQVTQPRTIETHPTIHHGVATIAGRLHPSMDMIDLLRAALPGGSITGAPKVRAMQIIDELEPVRRGPYCGCIGWLSRDAMCLNIAIRTMLIEGATEAREGRVDFSVGGGIVADSDPRGEYEETLTKAAALMAALK